MDTSDDELTNTRKQERERLESKLRGDGGSAVKEVSVDPTEPIHVDGTNELDDVVASYGVVLMDSYAGWCGPCKMLGPAVKRLAENTDAAVVKIDVDANWEPAVRYQVRGVLTMVLFTDGEAVEQFVGARGYDDLKNLVEARLA